jgi:WD40 repeat protein
MSINSAKYHTCLAGYFYGKHLYLDEAEKKKPNTRKLVELPWQQTKAEMWDEVTNTLCNLEFIQAKACAKMAFDLIYDINSVLQYIPDNSKKILQEKELQGHIKKYISELIAYAKGQLNLVEIPESVMPWSQKTIEEEIERIKKTPNRVDHLNAFLQFLGLEAGNMQRHSPDIRHFVVQQAWNHSVDGPVAEAIYQQSKNVVGSLLLKPEATRPIWNPYPAMIKLLNGHKSLVTAVAMTPDSRRAISVSRDKTIIVWDVVAGKVFNQLQDRDNATIVNITADGSRAITGGYSDNTLTVWDLDTGQPVWKLEGHTNPTCAVCMTPDGHVAVSGSSNGTIIAWDLESGRILRKIVENVTGLGNISNLEISQNGKVVVSASSENKVVFWDIQSCAIIFKLNNDDNSFSMTPDGRTLVSWRSIPKNPESLMKGFLLNVWDLRTGELKFTLQNGGKISFVRVTSDGRMAVSVHEKTLHLWNLDSGNLIRTIEGETVSISDISISADGRVALAGYLDNNLILWDLEKGMISPDLQGNRVSVDVVTVGQNPTCVITGSKSGLKIWDLETGKYMRSPEKHVYDIAAVCVTSDGRKFVSGNVNNNLIVWDLESGRLLYELDGGCLVRSESEDYLGFGLDQMFEGFQHKELHLTPDGRRVLWSAGKQPPRVWDLETGKLLHKLEGHTDQINAISLTPDGRKAVSGSSDKTMIVWDLESGKPILTFEEPNDSVVAIRMTSDGQSAVSIYENDTVIIWYLKDGKQMLNFKCPCATALSMTPDGRNVVSLSKDGIIIVWDLRTGKPLRTFEDFGPSQLHNSLKITPDRQSLPLLQQPYNSRSSFNMLKITPDGQTVVSVTDNTLTLWNFKTGNKLACFPARSVIRSIAVVENSLCCGTESGEIFFLKNNCVILGSGPVIITASYLWNFEEHQYFGPFWDCPLCGSRYELPQNIIATVQNRLSMNSIGSFNSPCLYLPEEAWEDSALLSECPKCHKRLKFNPFIAG